MLARFLSPFLPQTHDYPNVRIVPPSDIREWMAADEALVLDVREVREYVSGHIPGAVNMPLSSFDPARIPAHQGKRLVIHCRSGARCGMAAARLAGSGYTGDIARMQGGIIGWVQINGPITAGV